MYSIQINSLFGAPKIVTYSFIYFLWIWICLSFKNIDCTIHTMFHPKIYTIEDRKYQFISLVIMGEATINATQKNRYGTQ